MTSLEYNLKSHVYGKIWIWTAVVVVLLVPVAICVNYDAWPNLGAVGKGLLGVAPIYWTVGIIEIITYTPMLGTGGTFLAFVTGNLTSMKVPSALNAMQNADVKQGTEEGEIISTIAVAVCSIVTTIILIVGVILLSSITPILNSPTLIPAFDNILPALFGGLAVVYISKNWKVALVPLFAMIAIFIMIPSLANAVGVLVPVGIGISLLSARILYKHGKL
ncbi:MAG: hypothetical protein BKP49_00850 [Treponema sp. CETP13]|nr:MAG: hypothetical protein BKP49_00850 [Treponema sp. CETP13]